MTEAGVTEVPNTRDGPLKLTGRERKGLLDPCCGTARRSVLLGLGEDGTETASWYVGGASRSEPRGRSAKAERARRWVPVFGGARLERDAPAVVARRETLLPPVCVSKGPFKSPVRGAGLVELLWKTTLGLFLEFEGEFPMITCSSKYVADLLM